MYKVPPDTLDSAIGSHLAEFGGTLYLALEYLGTFTTG